MKRVIEILGKTQFGALATVENGKPKVRPFQFQFEENNRLYFCTSREKNVARQLLETPFAEFTLFSKALDYIRITGTIYFSEEIRLKAKVLSINPYYKEWFGTHENPNLLLFYFLHGNALLGNYSIYPPEMISF